MKRSLSSLLFEDAVPGNAPAEEQVHVFDFDDTLGLTQNANGVMLYKDGKPAHYNEPELKAWLKSMGVGPEDILPPGIVPVPERDGGFAVYVNSSALGRVQQKFPRDKQGVTTGYADKVNQPGETVLIDFTPSGYTDIKSTQPIDNTINKLKNANTAGARSIVITARKADGVGEDFHGKPVKASNADDMRRFLAQQGAEPTDGVLGVTGQNKGNAIISKYLKDEDPPEEIHFYDDLEKNTSEVEDAIALKEPSELHIYGPGDFAHGRADSDRPRKSYPEAPMKRPVEEAKKQKGLWHNMRQRRKKGLSRKKPGQKGYPKTLNLGESALRSLIRHEILREYTLGQALMSGQFFDAVVGLFKDAVAPTDQERLRETGDDKLIDEYQRFLGTLHLTPEYKTVWENYKRAQRSHSNMDPNFDGARDIQHPAGRAFVKLRTRVFMKLKDLDDTLSPENRDIWQADVEEQRQIFKKIFEDWSKGKLTTGRVLGLLDPRGIVEGKRKSGGRLREAGEMFAGLDLMQMQTTQVANALETALMDLEDVGCPVDSDARVITDQALDMVEKMRNRPDYDASMLPPVVNRAIYAVRTCKHIPPGEAQRIAGEIAMALDISQEIDRY